MTAYGTRRESDVNYGDRTRVSGAKAETLAWVSVERSLPWTIYAAARLTGPAADVARVEPVVAVEWGNGGASVSAEYPVGRRLRVPLVASMIRLTGRLVDFTTGDAAPAGVACEFDAFIAHGVDGLDQPNTRTAVATGSQGLVARGPQRVVGVEGYDGRTSGPVTWLMLFDAVALPPNGTAPVASVPAAPSPHAFRVTGRRDFRGGVFWAVSASPLILAHEPAALFRVETEILL